jgi:hypothetical protein
MVFPLVIVVIKPHRRGDVRRDEKGLVILASERGAGIFPDAIDYFFGCAPAEGEAARLVVLQVNLCESGRY